MARYAVITDVMAAAELAGVEQHAPLLDMLVEEIQMEMEFPIQKIQMMIMMASQIQETQMMMEMAYQIVRSRTAMETALLMMTIAMMMGMEFLIQKTLMMMETEYPMMMNVFPIALVKPAGEMDVLAIAGPAQ